MMRRRIFPALMAVLVALSALPVLAGQPPAGAPRVFGQWNVTGPYGGTVRSMAIAPDDPQRMYIGTSDGQLYRSRDAGKSWSRTVPGFDRPSLVVDNLIVDKANPMVLYIGVWAIESDKKGGIFKSVDGGDTWRELPEMHDRSVRALQIAPTDENLLIAGALDGVYRSRDAGAHWELISPQGHANIRNIESIAIDPRDPNAIYAGTWQLPWKTTDGGATWSNIKQGILEDSDMFSIAIIHASPDEVYASACSGIYQTRDAGQNWAKVQGIPFTSRRTRVLLAHPTRPEVVFAGTTQGLWRTTDDGKTWQLLTTKGLVINDIEIHPDRPDTVYLATDNYGVLVSQDLGQTFLETNAGYIHRHVLSLLPDASQANRVYASMYGDGLAGGLFVSADAGRTWRQAIKGLGGRDVFTLYQDSDAPASLYAGTSYGVFRSKDRGENWAFVGTVPKKPAPKKTAPDPADQPVPRPRGRHGMWPAPELAAASVMAIAGQKAAAKTTAKTPAKPAAAQAKKPAAKTAAKPAAKTTDRASAKSKKTPVKKPTGPALVTLEMQVNHFDRYTDANGKRWLLAATATGLYRTTDADKGWEKMSTEGLMGPFASVASAGTEAGHTLYLGTSRGLASSKDGGATWAIASRGPDEESVKSIAIDPRDPETVYVGCRGGLYKTSDGGRNWRKRGGGLPAGDITVVALDPTDPDTVYAGDYMVGGVYRSKDKAESWERLDAGLPSPRIWSLAPDPFDPGRVYAGSFSGGVYIFSTTTDAAAAR